MIIKEDLQLNGWKIFQDDELYRFTSDSIILSRFACAKSGDVVADFCSGSGIVGIHLYGENIDKIKSVTLFEAQESLAELSKKTIEYNNLIEIFNCETVRLQDIDIKYNNKFSLIVSNPPYMPKNAGLGCEKAHIDLCKTEVDLTLFELLATAKRTLKFGGRFCMVHRSDRLADIVYCMRKNGIEPKRIQFVQPPNKQPHLLLIEGVKGGKVGIKVLPNLIN